MRTLSNELRNQKDKTGNEIWAFSRWVEEYAFVHELTIEETLELALFKQEGIPYRPAVTK